MGRITLEQAARWCGGQIDPKYKEVAFLGATNDTRKLEPGQLFIALQGVRDGHDFIPAALEKAQRRCCVPIAMGIILRSWCRIHAWRWGKSPRVSGSVSA